MVHRIQLLEALQSSINIPFCLINNNSQISYCIPNIPMPHLMQYAISKYEASSNNQTLIIVEEPSIYIAISQVSKNSYLILGPCLPQAHSEEFLNHFLFGKEYSKDKDTIKRCINQSKLISLEELKNALCLAFFINTGKELNKEEIHVDGTLENKSMDNLLSLLNISDLSNEINNYEDKAETVDNIINNNLYSNFALNGIPMLDELIKKFQEPHTSSFTVMSLNHDRQTKYTFMVVANKICQEAVNYGVAEDTVNVIAEIICQKVDSAPEYFDVRPFYVELISAISEVINNQSAANYNCSPMISKCISYINSHLLQKLSLSDLAKQCNVSERWLSKCFRNEIGIAIPDYINSLKLQRSLQLLEFSNATIQEISDFFCFSNQSYYTKLFKEAYDCTPLEYRKGI